jgi:AcrR family transcriptional regulator
MKTPMPQPTEGRARAGRPARITRQDILVAARRVIDRDGVEHLTMRQLAKDIGSTPMAIYHHVRNKDELLALVLDDYAARVPVPELPEDPRERLIASAVVMHDILAQWPWIVKVLTSADVFGVSALWMVENIVDSAVQCGLPPEQAVHAYRTIWYYTAGEIIIRSDSARRREKLDRPIYRDEVFANLDPVRLPRLASLGDRWAPLTAQDTYRAGLEALVTGLLRTDRAD